MKVNSFFTILLLAQLCWANPLVRLEDERLKLENSRVGTLNQIENIKTRIETIEQLLIEKKDSLAKLVRLQNQLKTYNWSGVLAMENPYQLERNLKIIKILQNKQVNIARENKYYLDDLHKQKVELLQKISALEKLQQEIVKKEEEIKIAEQQRQADNANLKQESFLYYKGKLQRPVLGAIKVDFGPKLDKKNKFLIFNRGTTFVHSKDQPVHSLGPGQVIFRDRISYWGESIIIKHMDGYYSIYTGLKNCQVQLNDELKAGEKLGLTAKDNSYYELRHEQVVLNLRKWLKE